MNLQENNSMFLTIFMAIVFCAAITILLISAVAFVQYDGTNKWFFSSAPKEALEVLKPREKELFYGARTIHFFQYYCPEVAPVYNGRKYGYNLKSQLLKLLVIFPAASAVAAWICTRFQM